MLSAIKHFLRKRAPFLVSTWRRLKYSPIGGRTAERVFVMMYQDKKLREGHSSSGSGSSLAQTKLIRQALPDMIQELGCRSLLDVPCGDFFWIKNVNLNIDYIGGDIVEDIIDRNTRVYGNAQRRFIRIDLTQNELPKADLVLCRDCLVHFRYSRIFAALRNIKRSGSGYLLTTTFPEEGLNQDIPTGAWRPINLQLAPFRFPLPIRVINEGHPEADYRDKSLALWRIADIPDFE